MSERPILMSAPMVRALRSGTKTQTRRVVKLDPTPAAPHLPTWPSINGVALNPDLSRPSVQREWSLRCPYGAPGDRLWVKETWRPKASARAVGWEITYAADGEVLFSNIDRVSETWRCPKAAKTGNVTPLFMPRWASRITLEVTGVHVERLQSISEEDARAEGVERVGLPGDPRPLWQVGHEQHESARAAFSSLWESINGATSWAANPWVWVVLFKRVTP